MMRILHQRVKRHPLQAGDSEGRDSQDTLGNDELRHVALWQHDKGQERIAQGCSEAESSTTVQTCRGVIMITNESAH